MFGAQLLFTIDDAKLTSSHSRLQTGRTLPDLVAMLDPWWTMTLRRRHGALRLQTCPPQAQTNVLLAPRAGPTLAL